jgi:16S rRNA (cytosine967-C5)-methyltransferase
VNKRRSAPLDERIMLAGRLYATATKAKGPTDGVTARFFREHKELDDEARGFLAQTTAGMLRRRRWLEAAAQRLPFRATREALVCLYLLHHERTPVEALPVDQKLGRALVHAARAADEECLAIRCGLPDWLTERLLTQRGAEEGTRLCEAFAEAPTTTLRANGLKTDRQGLLDALAAEGIDAHATDLSPYGVIVDTPSNVFRTAAFKAGLFEMQDEASQLVAVLAGASPGQTVVDGCAGAGGKTLALAVHMENRGTLYALDVAGFRLDALKDRARRAGVHNIRIYALAPADDRVARLGERADVVLVDAPCSGTGVLRRNPDTRWKLRASDVERLLGQQAALLDAYAEVVKPKGRLIYATCSVLDEENDGQVAALLSRRKDLRQLSAPSLLRAAGVPLEGEGPALRLYPHQHGTDGFFAAVFEKVA